MTPRILPAVLPLLLVGCSYPKAIVVVEPGTVPVALVVADDPEDHDPSPPEITLRDPDVLSELPDQTVTGTGRRRATTDASTGTVIARPPEAPNE